MKLKTKQTLSVIFSVGGAIGTLATVLLARKAAMKEAEMRWYYTHQLTPDQGVLDLMKPIEQIKIIGPTYIPTAIAGILTIGSIIGSTVMSHKAQASLMSMAVIADQGWRKYKNEVKKIFGVETNKNILKNILIDDYKKNKPIVKDNNKELYYSDIIGYFQADPQDLMYAYSALNELVATNETPLLSTQKCNNIYDEISLLDFVKMAKATIIDSNVTEDILENWGWTIDYLSSYEKPWIHMDIETLTTDELEDDDKKMLLGLEPYPIKLVIWNEAPIFFCEKHLHLIEKEENNFIEINND